MKWIGSLMLLICAGCVIGAPPGFSDGDKWTVPLVGPLETDVYVVPVKINDKGPYLFYIDPDASISGVDDFIAKELELYTVQSGEEVSEVDHKVPVFVSEIRKLQVGDLTVSNIKARVHKFGTYWVGGRRVRGLLGRDVIADSLIFSANRDTGWATIATQGHLAPPADAQVIKYRNFFFRKLAKVNVDGKQATLHMDLGSPVSQLWDKRIDDWGLNKTGEKRRMTDEWGTIWETDHAANVGSVQVANQNVSNLLVVPYHDGRRQEEELDGSLGQNFFSRYNVTANWDKRKIYLSARRDIHATAKERIRRWGATFDGCKQDACIAVSVLGNEPVQQPPGDAPSAGPSADNAPQQAAEPGGDTGEGPPGSGARALPPAAYQLVVEREPSVLDISYEVLIEAVDDSGKPLGLPRLLLTMPQGARSLVEPGLDPNYAAAAGFAVLDVSPFARDCQTSDSGAARCAWTVPVR